MRRRAPAWPIRHLRTLEYKNCTAAAEEGGSAKKKAKLGHAPQPAAIVLDIEGTVAPISFVTQTLFPYAREHLEGHLRATFATEETRADVALLQAEVGR